MNIKNIAIIAHVDHGKTTLVDQLLTQSGTMKGQEDATLIMDSNDQEKERWITIYAKNTSVKYTYEGEEWTINIMDTPWHADFGSEVERVLKMVDSVLILVDAYEGPMPQTKFVLKKALEHGLRPIVVINKIDKPSARPDWVLDEMFDLFIALWANDEQADFPVIYASARDGYAFEELEQQEQAEKGKDITPLLDFVMTHVPTAEDNSDKPLRLQVVNLAYDNFVGRLGIGRITDGTVKAGQQVVVYANDGTPRKWKVNKVYTTLWVSRQEVKEAWCGDIVTIAGIPDIFVGETIWVEWIEPLEPITVDAPTLSMEFLVNNSPFAGREGKFVTSRNIVDRLEKEMETNVWLHVEVHDGWNRSTVSWRGELHISVLIETMRREGFELQVSAPVVLMKEEWGKKMEPIEEVVISVADEHSGSVIQMLSDRKGMMQNMNSDGTTTTLEFHVPTRWLLWARAHFILLTKGEWIMYSSFKHYAPYLWVIEKRKNGSLISMANGPAMTFSIWKLQDRGRIFVEPATQLYEGMIIGESAKPGDLTINLTKNKKLSNVRTWKADENMLLTPIVPLTLEDALSYIWPDEYVEITPKTIRVRKIHLKEGERKRH